METIGERLKYFRKKKNMTQGELAIALGVTAGFISKIESGLQKPSEPIIKLLEYSYGLNKEWILTGKGEMYYASCGGEGEEIKEAVKHEPANLNLLREVIEKVETLFEKEDLDLPPKKKAKLIILIYEELLEDESKRKALDEKVISLTRWLAA
ncbi:MAG: helix-turn-helix transcriptional regulator [Nitrospinae bacterium]|nr:helix-turn-helix transcriptional regulator [Nitrospinota bacterium]